MKFGTEGRPGSDPTAAVETDTVGIITVVGIALAAFVSLLPRLGESMFADEGATLYSSHLSWSNLWAQSLHVDLVLLPYYVLIHFWLGVSGSIEWVRALSLFSYFGTIVAIGWTGLRIAGRWCGVIAAVLTASSALLVEKSLNARPYELSTFLVALCAVCLLRWLDDERDRWVWGFSILALLSMAMQLFSLLAPVSMLVGLFVVRPECLAQRLRHLLAPLALIAIVAGAWIVACAGEVGQVNWIANESTESRVLTEIRGPAIGQVYDFVLFLIVVIAVTAIAIRSSRGERSSIVELLDRDRDILALTIGWVVIPTAILSVISFVHPIFSVRYVAASAPAVALLAAFVSVRVFPQILDPFRGSGQMQHRRLFTVLVVAVGLTVVAVLTFGYLDSATALQEDLQSPARYIAQHAQNGDVLALPDHAITSTFDYYLDSSNRQIPLWPQIGSRQRFVEGLDLALHPASGFPHRVWLVTDGSVPGVVRFVSVLKHNDYVLVNYKQFDGSSLLLFESKLHTARVLVPVNGQTVSGRATVLDAFGPGITEVRFVLTGGPFSQKIIGKATFTNIGYYFAWNTTSVPNGTYSLQSLATDRAGRAVYSPVVTIKVRNDNTRAAGRT